MPGGGWAIPVSSASLSGQAYTPRSAHGQRRWHSPRTLSVVLLTGCPFSRRSFSPLESRRSWILPAMADGSRLRTQMTLSRLLTTPLTRRQYDMRTTRYWRRATARTVQSSDDWMPIWPTLENELDSRVPPCKLAELGLYGRAFLSARLSTDETAHPA